MNHLNDQPQKERKLTDEMGNVSTEWRLKRTLSLGEPRMIRNVRMTRFLKKSRILTRHTINRKEWKTIQYRKTSVIQYNFVAKWHWEKRKKAHCFKDPAKRAESPS